MIPMEAVEAAAKAYQSILEGNGQPTWDELPEQRQDNRLYWMQAALEAAAPYMQGNANKETE